jgi:hypothetical protein
VLIDSILGAHDRRAALVDNYRAAIAAYKTSKDVKTFKSTKKSLDDRYKASSEEVAALVKDVQGLDGDANAKVPAVILCVCVHVCVCKHDIVSIFRS